MGRGSGGGGSRVSTNDFVSGVFRRASLGTTMGNLSNSQVRRINDIMRGASGRLEKARAVDLVLRGA